MFTSTLSDSTLISMGALLGLVVVGTASVVQGYGRPPISSLPITTELAVEQARADGVMVAARQYGGGFSIPAHASPFKTALYACESFWAALASCVNVLRKKARKASAAAVWGSVGVVMAPIVLAAH